ncbi:MAG: hypothetical protein J4N98_09060 [Chloroflexi bacterium]|nr:hypothetical protein [Chloroflexota bacterium]
MMRRNEGLAEELSRLFYNRSGPTLRAVQRRISQPGVWWKIANLFGLILGGLMVVASGLVPWWELRSGGGAGLDFIRGRAAFGFGALLLLMGFLRALRPSDQVRLATVPVGALLALAVIGLALLERQHGVSFGGSRDILGLFFPVRIELGAGYYLALYGGIIAFFGSLCGLAPDPDPAVDPPPRSARYAR